MEISGKKVVVIGGASGMGRASAELLTERGAQVAVLDREGSDGKDVADGMGGKFYPVDVTDFTGTEETLQAAVDDLGGLHVVVTTAGGGIAKRTMTKSGPHDLESFQLRGGSQPHRHLQHQPAGGRAHEQERARGRRTERGVIINTASIAAFEGQIGQVAYTAAKAGIAGMCLTMARDLGSLGIRVLAIAPSLFLTGLTAMVPDEMAATLTRDAAFPKRHGPARSSTRSWWRRSSTTRCSTASACGWTRDSGSRPSSRPAGPSRVQAAVFSYSRLIEPGKDAGLA